MKEIINHLDSLLDRLNTYIESTSESAIISPYKPGKWSKKEIIGHLIDSGVNNLKRFTEIQYENLPYKVIGYNQEGLVKSNAYQGADIGMLMGLLMALNKHIMYLMSKQTQKSLNFEIILPDGRLSNLHFLMEDYVVHFEHHVKQIIE